MPVLYKNNGHPEESLEVIRVTAQSNQAAHTIPVLDKNNGHPEKPCNVLKAAIQQHERGHEDHQQGGGEVTRSDRSNCMACTFLGLTFQRKNHSL